MVEVRDHGHGLPDRRHRRACSSASGAPTRAAGGAVRGAGLGLSIVAAIVDAHGGRVSAANAPGGGASFTISPTGSRGRSGAPDPAPAAAPA